MQLILRVRCNSRNYSANNDSTPNFVRTLLMRLCTLALLSVLLPGCSSDSDKNNGGTTPPVSERASGVFILNEGVYMAGNASLSFYNYSDKECRQDLFFEANDAPLGDVPTSMVVQSGKAYITLSNSGKIYVVNPVTCKYLGKISGLSSPRYIGFISDTKAYVSNLNEGVIDIIDPTALTITGSIDLGKGRCAEQLVVHDGFVYANLWSYGKYILKIDPSSDKVVDSLEVGIQPQSLWLDSRGRFWTLADGGYEGSPVGFAEPQIVCFDPAEMKILERFTIKRTPESMMFNIKMALAGDKIYYISHHLYEMSVNDKALPTAPLVSAEAGQSFYSIGVEPLTGDIFVGDAVDYTQAGMVYRYSSLGTKIDEFKVGISPGAFCFFDSTK